jgi:hypothetical protein
MVFEAAFPVRGTGGVAAPGGEIAGSEGLANLGLRKVFIVCDARCKNYGRSSNARGGMSDN